MIINAIAYNYKSVNFQVFQKIRVFVKKKKNLLPYYEQKLSLSIIQF